MDDHRDEVSQIDAFIERKSYGEQEFLESTSLSSVYSDFYSERDSFAQNGSELI